MRTLSPRSMSVTSALVLLHLTRSVASGAGRLWKVETRHSWSSRLTPLRHNLSNVRSRQHRLCSLARATRRVVREELIRMEKEEMSRELEEHKLDSLGEKLL